MEIFQTVLLQACYKLNVIARASELYIAHPLSQKGHCFEYTMVLYSGAQQQW